MTEHERLALALQTKAELPMTERAVTLLKAQTAEEWASETDPGKREALWVRRRVLEDILTMMVAAAAEADMAEHRATLAKEGFEP
jgi:hypothetical protein